MLGRGMIAFGAAGLACGGDCIFTEGTAYELSIIEVYDDSSQFSLDPSIPPPAPEERCSFLNDLAPGVRLSLSAHEGWGETCENTFTVEQPDGFSSFRLSPTESATDGAVYLVTLSDGCEGRWRLQLYGTNSTFFDKAVPGHEPPVIVSRHFTPLCVEQGTTCSGACSSHPTSCRDLFAGEFTKH